MTTSVAMQTATPLPVPAFGPGPAPAPTLESEPAAGARRRALWLAGGALGLGGLTTALTWGGPLGVSWLLLVVTLVVASFLAFRRGRPSAVAVGWALATVWLAGAFVVYASRWTAVIAVPASALMLAALPLILTRRLPWSALGGLHRESFRALGQVPGACVDAVQMPRQAFDSTTRSHLGHVVVGLVVGAPVSLVFAALLSADDKFAVALGRITSSSFGSTDFVFWSLAWSLAYAFAYLVHRRLRPDGPTADPVDRTDGPYRTQPEEAQAAPPKPLLRPLTWGVVLSQIIALFGLFVALNVGDLFAGHSMLQAPGTVTYAKHLHSGFFQLSFATLLSVLAVVAGHRLLRPRGDRAAAASGGRVMTALEVTLLVLTAVTLMSCWQRLHIYQQAYGFTHLRLGVGFVQLGIVGLLGLTIFKAIRRRWRGYAPATVSLGVALAVFASSIDTDLHLARKNVRRLESQLVAGAASHLDVNYLHRLSDDALPVLAEPYFENHPELRQSLVEYWNGRAWQRQQAGWRSFRGL